LAAFILNQNIHPTFPLSYPIDLAILPYQLTINQPSTYLPSIFPCQSLFLDKTFFYLNLNRLTKSVFFLIKPLSLSKTFIFS
jgi:hypothetical protein